MPSVTLISFDWLPLGPFDSRLWWLLIALFIALLFTIQAVEWAIEGAWPHQRRPSSFLPRARAVQTGWAVVALLIIPGGLLAIANVAAVMWQELEHTDAQVLGGWLLGVSWIVFLLGTRNTLGFTRLLNVIGVSGTIVLVLLLLIANILLLSSLLDILPDWETIEQGIEDGIERLIPFLGDDE
ncbi:MAG TPA: hypothetical protein VGR22_07560 [Thermomicrobiales bacterium]|nr:hypothetical protein [Thermomicrobiales bacterium]